ncbi:hypothetical protein PN465_13390 [Nodularia spumigena CS-584]|jgi:hypothetical protein|uniref:Uncharacterized protein n=1 Tax=Nodularia spumigena UHCC 0060 TaxID=3110300 RepID=A0ABU5URD3_NODSP|nr:hypothetical protein [Nodularia spumigena]AHJ27809.1 hypothetical protein NSP_14750 [Nodularia spumigena CCY9414]MDB9383203.1 hypothetical protein [Nodularia spumigena CS-584]MEA5526802.1 hypothetical protein [Nodularia spumigena UHCC 0143]MEA5555382.1 hypothetical protein [Nodularia spumigena CH309]MEA5608837.1 hypothetical protein [Nodularia spumigena UHCC 0060]
MLKNLQETVGAGLPISLLMINHICEPAPTEAIIASVPIVPQS